MGLDTLSARRTGTPAAAVIRALTPSTAAPPGSGCRRSAGGEGSQAW